MKTLFSALTILGLLIPAEGFAYRPGSKYREPRTCEEIAKGDNSPAACRSKVEASDRLKKRWPSVAAIAEKNTQELCQSASSASKLNNNRCEEAVEDLKNLLNQRKEFALRRRDEGAELVKQCQACQNNIGAASCQNANVNFSQNFSKKSRDGISHRQKLINAAKRVEDEMFQLSEDYGQNISDLQRDMITNKPTSPAASEIGASSISDGLSKHGNGSPAEIFRAVEQLRGESEVTDSDMQTAQSIQSKYARESLTRALEAKAARLEMQKENDLDKQGLGKLDPGTKGVADNTTNLASVDPQASQSGLQGDTSASGAAAGGGLPQMPAGGSGAIAGGTGTANTMVTDAGTYNPNAAKGDSNYMLNGVTSPMGGESSAEIEATAYADASASVEGAENATSSSRMPSRDSLRAKLAEQLALGQAGSVEASRAAGGKALSGEAKSKAAAAAANATPDMFVGFAADNFSGGGADSFSMAQSETDAAVKEMMSEFEGPTDSGAGRGRFLASAGESHSTPEILAADSSDLFHRTKEFYERCQKRGCVTR